MFFSLTGSKVPKNCTIEIWSMLLPRLKKPTLTGSVSFRVMAKWIAAAEFSLMRPSTLRSAMAAAFTRDILDRNPQWAGTVRTASLMSEPACAELYFLIFFRIIPTSCSSERVSSPWVK